MKQYAIYKLLDPRTLEVRYIGCTTQPLLVRLQTHMRQETGSFKYAPKPIWIEELKACGLLPRIVLIEQTYDIERECYWIRYFRKIGANLTNSTDGGKGISGIVHSQEVRKKIGDASLKHWQSPTYREAVLRNKIGRTRSEETRKKMSKPKSEQHRINAALARRKVWDSDPEKGRAKGDKNGLRKHPESVLRGEKNPIAKLNEEKVREMRRLYASKQANTVQLGRMFGVSQGIAWGVVNGRMWKHVTP